MPTHARVGINHVADSAAGGLRDFLEATVELTKVLARARGHDGPTGFDRRALTTWKRDLADPTGVEYTGVGRGRGVDDNGRNWGLR